MRLPGMSQWTHTFLTEGAGRDKHGQLTMTETSEPVWARAYQPKWQGRTPPGVTSVVESTLIVRGSSSLDPGDTLTDPAGEDWEVLEVTYVRGGGISHWSAGVRRVRGEV